MENRLEPRLQQSIEGPAREIYNVLRDLYRWGAKAQQLVDRMGHIRRCENQNSIGTKSLRRPVEKQRKICQVFDHVEEIERIDELLSNVVDWPVMIRRPPSVRSRLVE